MSDYTFINEFVQVFEGQDALDKLQRKNDLYFWEEDGVLRVPRWRWKEAQAYQYNQQIVRGQDRVEDRNTIHFENLDRCGALEGLEFSRGIELGCGPFTNIWHIEGVQDVVLVDPLIGEYVNHPNSRIGDLPVSRMIATGIEDMPNAIGQFDLVVMINVLEHCRDAWQVQRRVRHLVAPGGYLIFGEKYYGDVRALLKQRYDAGHPIKPTARFLAAFAEKQQLLYVKRVAHKIGTMMYFIGRRYED